jgi:phenylacetic acid degradation operon negative regulatory protein
MKQRAEHVDLRSTAEDWLLAILWGVDQLSHPSLSRLGEPYEAWERRWGFQQYRRLERRGLLKLERQLDKLVCHLTETGRHVALGGRDPFPLWSRPWDNRWRMVLFDLPVGRQAVRQRLLRWLHQRGFGYLQNSVWISPDPLSDIIEALKDFPDAESFTVMEAQCVAGHSNADLVSGAWDFPRINRCYESYMDWLESSVLPNAARKKREALGAWLHQERLRWSRPFHLDPLLPRALWPSGYLGERACQARRRRLQEIGAA